MLYKDLTTIIYKKLYRIFKEDNSSNNEEHQTTPSTLASTLWSIKIHKPGDRIRHVLSFYNTPLSGVSYLKPLAKSTIRLKNTTDLKQHLSTKYILLGYIESLQTSCDMKKLLTTNIPHFENKPHLLLPNMSENITLLYRDIVPGKSASRLFLPHPSQSRQVHLFLQKTHSN